jgi:gliding motility associated protien GldN
MKSTFGKVCLVMVLLATMVVESSAQARSGRRRGSTGTKPATTPNQQQNNNNTAAPQYNPYGNLPISVDSSSTYSDTVKKSLRQDAAFDKSAITERTPLPYEHLRWDDALYTQRVWREIDLREKMNMPFRFKAEDDNGDQRLIMIILRAVRNGEITAFDAQVDDRFTTPLSIADVNKTMSGETADTIKVMDVNDPNKQVGWKVIRSSFNPDDVMKFRVKEEWVFDRESSRLFARILGIAPLKTIFMPDGITERGNAPMFWVYYPDLRPTLAKYEVYNPKNMGTGRMTWEELFESRMFSSYIVKSTLDNPTNKMIKGVYKDPILALLEGENIKDKMFNYEQDLWSY